MTKYTCWSALLQKKKQNKVVAESTRSPDFSNNIKNLKIRLEYVTKPYERNDLKTASVTLVLPFTAQKHSLDVNVTSHEKASCIEASEKAYEHEKNATKSNKELTPMREKMRSGSFEAKLDERLGNRAFKDVEKSIDLSENGYLSDPGANKPELWSSPKLTRSCSNLETKSVLRKVANKSIPTSMFSKMMQDVPKNLIVPGSPESVVSQCSADRVMLKKHSSSQVLPSRSRKLWWKLFLWSHRNLHKCSAAKPQKPKAVNTPLDGQAGYASDSVEPNRALELSKRQLNKKFDNSEEDNKSLDDFYSRDSGLFPQDQWIAFAAGSSSHSRVQAWVRDLELQYSPPSYSNDKVNISNCEGVTFPASPENAKSSKTTNIFTKRPDVNLSEDILYANYVIQSLNSSSTVAHISGIGLRVIPSMSCFFYLRSVNLSNNSIACITPGSLPKVLHTLNLSRNKIHAIEGLRELTRLRVLDLSYNLITSIGQVIYVYLCGNKISEVDGLHRLLKLTVLDLSFNKITTTRAMGELVANYDSLQALNLLGNPIQSNIGDDQLQKSVCSMLPKLVYLNKQVVKQQRSRVLTESNVAKGSPHTDSSWSARRRGSKRNSARVPASTEGGIGSRENSRSRSRGRVDRRNTMQSSSH